MAMRLRLRWIALAVLAGVGQWTDAHAGDATWVTEYRASYSDYEFEIRGHGAWEPRSINRPEYDQGREFNIFEHELVIRRTGKTLFTLKDYRIEIDTSKKLYFLGTNFAIGDPIAGVEIPILVAVTDSGGAHCCSGVAIFEIGKKFRLIDKLDFGDSSFAFENMDGQSDLEITLGDDNFVYWNTGFADSPMPKVILKYRDGKYQTATDLMKQLPLDREKLSERARIIRRSDRWLKNDNARYDPELWKLMLDLIYSGNYRQAQTLLGWAWPPSVRARSDLHSGFSNVTLGVALIGPTLHA